MLQLNPVQFAVTSHIGKAKKTLKEKFISFIFSKLPHLLEEKYIPFHVPNPPSPFIFQQSFWPGLAESWILRDEWWIWKIFCGPVKCDSAGLAQDLTSERTLFSLHVHCSTQS